VILSYRSQDDFLHSPLPPALAKATKAISQSDFVHESVSYIIKFTLKADAEVVMRFEVTMNLVNRSKKPALYQDYFDPAGGNKQFISAAINRAPVNKDDPDRRVQSGLLLSYKAEPGKPFEVKVIGESTFYRRDNELVGVYLPCNFLSIRIEKPPDELVVHVQALLPVKVDAERLDTGDLLFEYRDGVLPFQGTRVFWEPRGG
jgi:hypothetical protein